MAIGARGCFFRCIAAAGGGCYRAVVALRKLLRKGIDDSVQVCQIAHVVALFDEMIQQLFFISKRDQHWPIARLDFPVARQLEQPRIEPKIGQPLEAIGGLADMNRILIGEIDFLESIALMMRHGDHQMQGVVKIDPSFGQIVSSETERADLRLNTGGNLVGASRGKAIAVHQRLEQRRVEKQQMGGGKQQTGFGIDMTVEMGQSSTVIQLNILQGLTPKNIEIVVDNAKIVRVGAEQQIDHLAVRQAAAGQKREAELRDVRIFLQ